MKQLLKKISPFNNRTEMSTGLFVVKKILAFFLCYIVGLLIAEGAVILLHFALGKNIFVGEMFDMQTITLITYYGYIVMIGVALFYWKRIEKKPFSKMGLTKGFSHYVAGIILGVLLIAVSIFAHLVTGNMEYQGMFVKTDFLVILLFMGGFVVQGAAEEILCRGIVFHSLKEKIPVWMAIVISTILFIIPHCSTLFAGKIIYGIIGIVNLILISILFSLLTIRFQSIWAACGLHSFWNAILYSVLGLNLSGNEETVTAILNMQSVGENIWNGGVYGIEASLITTMVLGLATVLIFLKKKP